MFDLHRYFISSVWDTCIFSTGEFAIVFLDERGQIMKQLHEKIGVSDGDLCLSPVQGPRDGRGMPGSGWGYRD